MIDFIILLPKIENETNLVFILNTQDYVLDIGTSIKT